MQIEIGKYIKQPQGFKAFVLHSFPPEKGFPFDRALLKKADKATRLIGKLDGITKLLPDSNYFLWMYLRKDATSSSQIEGTQATMMDAIEADARINTSLPTDVDDIMHYIQALHYGMKRVSEDRFPISNRFICELHGVLMKGARATHHCYPGEFRKSQNWIGGTKPDNAMFVPPPIDNMHDALSDLEKFIHADDEMIPIIKAALLHGQFETIHPFADGNGRTGRMLITFYLWQEEFLEIPALFLSSYFKRHQQLYYEKLNGYHFGYISKWVDFFLDGVIDIALEAIETVSKITALRAEDMAKIQALGKRASESAMMVLPKLYEQPIVNVATVEKWTGFTFSGAQSVINRFIDMGILQPKDVDKTYGQSYLYRRYIDIFMD